MKGGVGSIENGVNTLKNLSQNNSTMLFNIEKSLND